MREREIETGAADLAVRERLLRAATQLFTRKGYASTTVREIVEAAGVTKPALYYYFTNKEAIYLELMQGAFARYEATVEASRAESGGAAARVLRLCDRVFTLFLEDFDIVRVMHSIYYGPPQGAPFFDFDAFHLNFHAAIRELVEEGRGTGEFRAEGNVDDMSFAVLGAIDIAMELELCHPEMSPGRAGLERILKVIFEGIATGSAEKAAARKEESP